MILDEVICGVRFLEHADGTYLLNLVLRESGMIIFLLLKENKLHLFCKEIDLEAPPQTSEEANQASKSPRKQVYHDGVLYTVYKDFGKILKVKVRKEDYQH